MHEPDDEFAIPIVRLWEHLLVPVQGEISDQQAAELSSDVLEAVHRTGATNLLIDVSGVAVMDSHLCATFARLAASARMMGVNSVISGLTPEIVMTLQTMGVELEEIRTTLSLEEALMMLGIGKLHPVAPIATPARRYLHPTPSPGPGPAPSGGCPGPVSAPPYGSAPNTGPCALPPSPFQGARWSPPGQFRMPPQGAPQPPPRFPGGPPWSGPAAQTPGGFPGATKGDLDE